MKKEDSFEAIQDDMPPNNNKTTTTTTTTATTTMTNSPIPPWFQETCHSLRIAASDVAAVTGFHPYRNLPKLYMDHIYQGRMGMKQLHHDTTLLGISMVSEEEMLRQVAQKAGPSTCQALQTAWQIQRGTKQVGTIEGAKQLHNHIIQQAQQSQALTCQELKVLQMGTQQWIHTGFGRTWEDVALNLYEQQSGWEVQERNSEIRAWPFAKYDPPPPTQSQSQTQTNPKDDNDENNSNNNNAQFHDSIMPTARPIQSAYPIPRETMLDTIQRDHDEPHGKRERMASAVIDLTDSPSMMMQDDNSNEETIASRNHIGDVMTTMTTTTTRTSTTTTARLNSSNESDLPYFIIRGSVDGIRDELVPAPTIGSSSMDPPCGSPGDDSWMFRKVIVECKHRMNRLQPSPPLYEQIQAITYCFMYQVEDADLVQVLRKPVSRSQKSQSIKRKMMMMMIIIILLLLLLLLVLLFFHG